MKMSLFSGYFTSLCLILNMVSLSESYPITGELLLGAVMESTFHRR